MVAGLIYILAKVTKLFFVAGQMADRGAQIYLLVAKKEKLSIDIPLEKVEKILTIEGEQQ